MLALLFPLASSQLFLYLENSPLPAFFFFKSSALLQVHTITCKGFSGLTTLVQAFYPVRRYKVASSNLQPNSPFFPPSPLPILDSSPALLLIQAADPSFFQPSGHKKKPIILRARQAKSCVCARTTQKREKTYTHQLPLSASPCHVIPSIRALGRYNAPLFSFPSWIKL